MKKVLAVVLTLVMTGFLIGTVIVPAVAQGGSADIPNTIGYQGYLTDSGGTPIETPVNMTFALYPALSGGSPVWAEVHQGVQPNQGLFSVELGGSGSPIYANDLDSERWLGVTVSGDDEMDPRQKLSSVAYSLRADVANRATVLDAPDGSPVDAVYVDNDGNVGIGTNTPTVELEVIGEVNVVHTNPIHVGAITDNGTTELDTATDIWVSGRYAYVTSGYGLEILDISDPANPTHVGAITDDATTAMSGAFALHVSGKYAYIAAGTDDGVEILDISDPTNPTHVGAIFDDGTTALDYALDIYVSGKYAYIAGYNDNGIEILDISDPANPTHVGAITDDGTTALDGPCGIHVSGKYAYIASAIDNGVEILDISDPTNPTHVGAITDDGTTALYGASDIYISGKYAYVASGGDDGVEILDVSDPANPTHLGAIFDNGTTELDGANSIYVSGKYAYVTAGTDDGVEILDISDPANPTHVGAITDNGTTELNAPMGIYVSGNYAYVASFIDDGVEILDIGGIDAPAADIGSIAATSVEVSENVNIGKDLNVGKHLNVGEGGLYVSSGNGIIADGEIAATGTITATAFVGDGSGISGNVDNFGNHIATQNIELDGNYLSGDGDSEGITVDSSGNVGIGTSPDSDYQLYIKADANNSYAGRFLNTSTGLQDNYGIHAVAAGAPRYNIGIWGYAGGTASTAIRAECGGNGCYAARFQGDVAVFGSVSKSGGSFKIDHPLEPASKYLHHSFVESPDMKNIYDGVAVLDENGEATVELPDWFEALNRDFRYQLTCIGRYAPVFIAEEIAGNQFKISGGELGMKVSWLVTGIRQDAWANENRIPIEEDKPADEQGLYLHPEVFGLSETLSVNKTQVE